MHLSPLSDGFFSDVVDDSGRPTTQAAARAHRDGVLRGLGVIGVAGLLIGLTLLAYPAHRAEADTRCRINSTPPQAAVWWEASPTLVQTTEDARSFHASAQTGTAVSLVALRQRFRSACR